MKNFRKLILAGVMLVFALIAVVSSTYAWFTLQQEAEVSDIKLGAASSGKDLQISADNENWGYFVDLEAISANAKLTPVTFSKKSNTFNEIVIDKTEGNKFKYNTATMIKPGAVYENETKGYLAFNLFFKTSNTVTELLFDTRSLITAAENKDEVLKTTRIMFIVGSDLTNTISTAGYTDGTTLVYEPYYSSDSTYGNGDYYKVSNKYIALDAFTHSKLEPFGKNPVQPTGDDAVYTLDTVFVNAEKYATKTSPDVKVDNDDIPYYLSIGALTNTDTVRVQVFVWLEGWDGDTTNAAAEQQFTLGLKFRAN